MQAWKGVSLAQVRPRACSRCNGSNGLATNAKEAGSYRALLPYAARAEPEPLTLPPALYTPDSTP